MNLTVDIGNTAAKWALFDGQRLVESGNVATEGWPEEGWSRGLACASGAVPADMPAGVEMLTAKRRLPIGIDYATPESLGADRIAAACGAWAAHRGKPCLVVDAGTCITVDFVDGGGVFRGGAIMPGLGIKLSALHTFTAKLPLVDYEGVEHAPVRGRSTEECILAGTVGATMLALAGYVTLYREKAPEMVTVLTGGDAHCLIAAGATAWDYRPMLTFEGLNEIMTNG